MKYCTSCGTENADSKIKCKDCGSEVFRQTSVKHINNSVYPCLSFSKVVLRIIGVLCVLAGLIFGIITMNDTPIMFFIGIIIGAIMSFGFFLLAEIIQLFVKMGQNVDTLAQNVRSLKEQKKD